VRAKNFDQAARSWFARAEASGLIHFRLFDQATFPLQFEG
jgi:hypothetical protein